jgi:hypothetical protein
VIVAMFTGQLLGAASKGLCHNGFKGPKGH